ncbi:MAG: hypothetical protein M1815_003825 [Lichina confinis]|nr:MAG: hypothetical protein M1815_003825 [Lichina confinis]
MVVRESRSESPGDHADTADEFGSPVQELGVVQEAIRPDNAHTTETAGQLSSSVQEHAVVQEGTRSEKASEHRGRAKRAAKREAKATKQANLPRCLFRSRGCLSAMAVFQPSTSPERRVRDKKNKARDGSRGWVRMRKNKSRVFPRRKTARPSGAPDHDGQGAPLCMRLAQAICLWPKGYAVASKRAAWNPVY